MKISSEQDNFLVKVKFYDLSTGDQEDPNSTGKKRLRIRFVKKRGDIFKWY